MIPGTLTEQDIAAVVARLEQELGALGDPGDVPLTFNGQAEHARKQSSLTGCIRTIRRAQAILSDVEPQINNLTMWRDHLDAWRTTLVERLACLDANDPAARGVQLSIERIDRGLDLMNELYPANLPLDDMMRDAGYVPRDAVARAAGGAWSGSMPQVEETLTELIAKRDDAKDRLERALAG